MRRVVLAALILLLLSACGGERPAAQRDTDEVASINLYVAGDEQWIAPLLARFTEQSGVEVETLRRETPEVVRMLLQEGAYTAADLVVAPDAAALEQIGEAGMLAPLPAELLDAQPRSLRGAGGEWAGLAVVEGTVAAPRWIGIVRESDPAIELVRLMLSDEGKQLLGY